MDPLLGTLPNRTCWVGADAFATLLPLPTPAESNLLTVLECARTSLALPSRMPIGLSESSRSHSLPPDLPLFTRIDYYSIISHSYTIPSCSCHSKSLYPITQSIIAPFSVFCKIGFDKTPSKQNYWIWNCKRKRLSFYILCLLMSSLFNERMLLTPYLLSMNINSLIISRLSNVLLSYYGSYVRKLSYLSFY